VGDNGDGSMFRRLCRWEVGGGGGGGVGGGGGGGGGGGSSGMVADDSETFRLDNLKPEVNGGVCGAADRGGVSHNGSNK